MRSLRSARKVQVAADACDRGGTEGGAGRRRGPGGQEDERNTQLVGPAGQRLRKELKKIDVDLDRDCWKTNAVICRPGEGKNPTDEQVAACRPNLLKTVEELRPSTMILLGLPAVRSTIGWLWREDPGSMARWAGWRIPCQRWNCWVCPTYHSSYVMRTERDEKNRTSGVFAMMFAQHLRSAFALEGRPWKERPRFDLAETTADADEAARWVRRMTRWKKSVAFDYETNMLKPDGIDAEIRSCAISDGERTISYLVHGPAFQATREFLRSPLPKIAANIKFEERWSRAVFKTPVRNWCWDTMLAAHVLDNRRGICGLKFQAFVKLGQEGYDDAVAPYLEAPSSNATNRIRQVDWRDLLKYNGMDACLTWHLAKKQREEMEGY